MLSVLSVIILVGFAALFPDRGDSEAESTDNELDLDKSGETSGRAHQPDKVEPIESHAPEETRPSDIKAGESNTIFGSTGQPEPTCDELEDDVSVTTSPNADLDSDLTLNHILIGESDHILFGETLEMNIYPEDLLSPFEPGTIHLDQGSSIRISISEEIQAKVFGAQFIYEQSGGATSLRVEDIVYFFSNDGSISFPVGFDSEIGTQSELLTAIQSNPNYVAFLIVTSSITVPTDFGDTDNIPAVDSHCEIGTDDLLELQNPTIQLDREVDIIFSIVMNI